MRNVDAKEQGRAIWMESYDIPLLDEKYFPDTGGMGAGGMSHRNARYG